MTIEPKINIQKFAAEFLYEKYKSEFEVIDNLNQHPKGENFNQWLLNNGYIDAKNYIELKNADK